MTRSRFTKHANEQNKLQLRFITAKNKAAPRSIDLGGALGERGFWFGNLVWFKFYF